MISSPDNKRQMLSRALQRRVVSPDRAEYVRRWNETQEDWRAQCPKCSERLEGSLATIRKHVEGCGK